MASLSHAPSRAARWRSLWWQFTLRAIEMKHRGSYLGFVWAVLSPVFTAALYVVVLGFIFDGRFHVAANETGFDYALGVFLGLLLFHVVSETLSSSPQAIVSQPNLVKKVIFPLEILPLAPLGASWLHALVSMALVAGAAALWGHGLHLKGMLWLPLILAPLLLLTVGLSLLFSVAGAFFRDLAQMVPLAAQLLLWSSAVFFTPEKLAEKSATAWAVLKWNPLLHTIDLARDSLLWGHAISLPHLAYTWICGFAAVALGALCFRAGKGSLAESL
jgi:lipopolysaccharide transport system permease protein